MNQISTKVINTSGIEPCGSAVLVEPYMPEVKNSTIYIPPTVDERQKMIEMRAIVIDIGPEAWKDEKAPRAEIGEEVMIVNYSGRIVIGPNDGKTYRIINANDIYCKVKRTEV